MSSVQVSVQAEVMDRDAWLALVREVEDGGFDGLYVGDHPGTGCAPFVALATAAAITERIRLGTCVLNGGLWDPMPLAVEAATLDMVSGGRVILGVGAGHTPQEWTATGRALPSSTERVERLVELVLVTRALLSGEPVPHRGSHFTLANAMLTDPRPVQQPVPILVGGNGTRVLRFGAEHADIVGITGMTRTLDDGHHHEVDWSPSGLDRILRVITEAADAAGRRPQLEALVQHVEITNDAPAAAKRLSAFVPGATIDDLLSTPFVWIGTSDEIRLQLENHRARSGIERFVVRAPAMSAVRRILG